MHMLQTEGVGLKRNRAHVIFVIPARLLKGETVWPTFRAEILEQAAVQSGLKTLQAKAGLIQELL